MAAANGKIHHYNADARVIEGILDLPLRQEIRPQAHVLLPEEGGYLSNRVENFRVEEVVSIRSGYAQVAGNRDPKPGHGFATLTTVVVEGLNVLEVLTADRVVGQIIADHPLEGNVPSISFLGTRFENLRIAGHPVKLDLDLGILGGKPANDAPYTQDAGLKERISGLYRRIRESQSLPAELAERYNRLSSDLGGSDEIELSLVNGAAGDYPGQSFGHVITVPGFGKITLAKLRVRHEKPKEGVCSYEKTTVTLTMVDLELGCAASGHIPIGTGSSNGGTGVDGS